MTNIQIIKDYKSGIFHPDFSAFYCKELDKHLACRILRDEEEKAIVLSEYKNNNVPPNGLVFVIKSSGAVT
jgi:hypothetical protein